MASEGLFAWVLDEQRRRRFRNVSTQFFWAAALVSGVVWCVPEIRSCGEEREAFRAECASDCFPYMRDPSDDYECVCDVTRAAPKGVQELLGK